MSSSEIDAIRARLAAAPWPASPPAGRASPSCARATPCQTTCASSPRTRAACRPGGRRLPGQIRTGCCRSCTAAATSRARSSATARWSRGLGGREAGARTLALAYRLAPEHPFPAGLEEALAGYRYLLASGIAPERVALCVESAGGGLALAAAVSLREAGLPLPGCLWLSSPWSDFALTGASLETKAAVDPRLSRAYLAEVAAAYIAGADPCGPLVSPLRADLSGLSPLLIQAGSAETLLDDSVVLALAGAGLALPYATAPRLALAVLPPALAGQGAGFVNACTLLAGSAGVTLAGWPYRDGGLPLAAGLIAAAALGCLPVCRGLPEVGRPLTDRERNLQEAPR